MNFKGSLYSCCCDNDNLNWLCVYAITDVSTSSLSLPEKLHLFLKGFESLYEAACAELSIVKMELTSAQQSIKQLTSSHGDALAAKDLELASAQHEIRQLTSASLSHRDALAAKESELASVQQKIKQQSLSHRDALAAVELELVSAEKKVNQITSETFVYRQTLATKEKEIAVCIQCYWVKGRLTTTSWSSTVCIHHTKYSIL